MYSSFFSCRRGGGTGDCGSQPYCQQTQWVGQNQFQLPQCHPKAPFFSLLSFPSWWRRVDRIADLGAANQRRINLFRHVPCRLDKSGLRCLFQGTVLMVMIVRQYGDDCPATRIKSSINMLCFWDGLGRLRYNPSCQIERISITSTGRPFALKY